jgi:peptidoglycan/LPS O-acetylase OafA/YrhL
VGLITGFFVINFGREYRLNRNIKIFGTIMAILFGLACLFTTYPDYILASGLNRSITVAYQSLARTFWSIAIGWLLFLCSIHQGGLVNRILSWSIWAPLARLNYSCYLIHSTVLHTMIYSQKMPFYYQPHLVVNNFIAQIFFSYVSAIVVTIFFETPFFVLEKRLFKR